MSADPAAAGRSHRKMVLFLSRLAENDCVTLCHRVVDGLCGRGLPRQADYSAPWSVEDWLQLLDSLRTFFLRAVRNQSSDDEVRAGLGNLPDGRTEVLLGVLRAREEDIRGALRDQTDRISSSWLQDFDWQLKVALSSDKISSLHTPLLSLSLDLREDGRLLPVTVEMNREELNTLITSLEAANKVVLQMK